MSKSRKDKKRVRPHELSEDDLASIEKPNVDQEPEPVRPPLRAVKPAPDEVKSLYREGQVVYVPVRDAFRTGTIVNLTNAEAWVLDDTGYLHVVRIGVLAPVVGVVKAD